MRTRYPVGALSWNSSLVWHSGILLLFILVALLCIGSSAAQSSSDGSLPEGAAKIRAKPDPSAGRPVFERYCAPCHGMSGDGGRGPRLNRSYLPHAPDDNELRSVITNGIPPSMPDASYLSEEEIANVAAHIRSLAKLAGEIVPGNAGRGAFIYVRSGCAACHIQSGKGASFGPDLTGIGDIRSGTFLKSVLRNPSSELPDGFLMVTAGTREGKNITGIRVNEDTFTIQIKDQAGNLYSFRKKDLQRLTRHTGQTPMPSFEKILSPAELDDLVSFLAASRQLPAPPSK